jgi:hypothetical protein
MYMNARVYIADVLDQVVVEATIFVADWKKEPAAETITCRATTRGTGEEVPQEWLKDALIALVETL